jgi:hypothetical protein
MEVQKRSQLETLIKSLRFKLNDKGSQPPEDYDNKLNTSSSAEEFIEADHDQIFKFDDEDELDYTGVTEVLLHCSLQAPRRIAARWAIDKRVHALGVDLGKYAGMSNSKTLDTWFIYFSGPPSDFWRGYNTNYD